MSVREAAVESVPPSWLRTVLVRHPLIAFFALAYIGTWTAFLPMVLDQNGLGLVTYTLPDVAVFVLFVVSTAGPALAGIIVTRATAGTMSVRQLLRRIVLWRVGIRWYLFALFGFLVLWLVGFSVFLGATPFTTLVQQWPLLFSVFVPGVLLGIFIPSLGEEPGWRGFALPRLQRQSGPVLGSLILGFLHGLWHLPAFLTPLLGPFAFPDFTAFVLTAMAGTIFYTWLYNNTNGSIFLAILLHASSNAASMLLTQLIPTVPDAGWRGTLLNDGWANVIIFGVGALVLIAGTRGRLSYEAEEVMAPASRLSSGATP